MLELRIIRGVYAIGSLSTGVHFYTNGIDRDIAHASRIARHLVGKPVYSPAHVAMIIPGDLGVWANFVLEAVPAMLQNYLIPFVYIFAKSNPTCVRLESSRERTNNFILESLRTGKGLDVSFSGSENRGGSGIIDDKLRETYGISVRSCGLLSPSLLVLLKEQHIEVGVLFGNNKEFGVLGSLFHR